MGINPPSGRLLGSPYGPPIVVASTDSGVPAVDGTSLITTAPHVGSGLGGGVGVSGHSGSGAGVSGTSDSGAGVFGTAAHFDGVHGESQSKEHAGVSGINTSGGSGVWGNGGNGGGPGVFGTASAFDGVHGESQSKEHAGVSGINDAGGFGVWAEGTPAGHFEGDVEVTGDVILTGADCAEEFDVGSSADAEPGTVMILDQNGSLRPSEHEYDKRVAGVVSGAGDYRPGLILDRRDSLQKRTRLALVGKVYCKADAGYAPIEVGDLLTSSPTPGHAMRAVDSSKAFGAVIGKALRSMSAGQKGLIPILVALQ